MGAGGGDSNGHRDAGDGWGLVWASGLVWFGLVCFTPFPFISFPFVQAKRLRGLGLHWEAMAWEDGHTSQATDGTV